MRDELNAKYPKTFKRYVSFACGEGWLPIIENLARQLEPLMDGQDLFVSDIKEKFGGLRVYMSHYNDEIDRLIEEAEEACSRTCETCGKPAVLRKKGRWMYTLCEACFESR